MGDVPLQPVSGLILALVGVLSIPAVRAVGQQVRQGAPKNNFYEDKDGNSTPESIASFSNKTSKARALFFAVLAFSSSVMVSVLATLHRSWSWSAYRPDDFLLGNWLLTASWALILIQTTLLSLIHDPVRVHHLGIWSFLSSILAGTVLVIRSFRVLEHEFQNNHASAIFRVLNIIAFLGSFLASVLIPRRPSVVFRNSPVDCRNESTIFSRYTWSYINGIIVLANKKGDLDNADIPQPDHTIRAEAVLADWKSRQYNGSLIWKLVSAYKMRILLQVVVTALRCIVSLGPFWAMLRLINILQDRGGGGSPDLELWGLVILLSLLSFIEQWMESWNWYFARAMISKPMQAQLSSLIYEKSLRRKNVKTADSSKENATSSTIKAATGDKEEEEGNEADDGKGYKSNQAILNLVGVDTKRIYDFSSIYFLIISSVGKLLVYSAFLVQLIGWIPFSAGIASWIIILPISTHFSKRYIRLSDKIMKIRDEKLATINEALVGIRQIKFAALEKQWEERIMGMRKKELGVSWQIFLGETALYACWVVSPILLAACSLAAYVLIHGELSPSVAFVSISIFKSLELTLGALPELITDVFDTMVSIRRIDAYLSGPEMEKTLSEGSKIAFENATIAWPADSEAEDGDRFLLRSLDLSFPAGELSVISGQTGTGKSLVLSALIGEADLLNGKIRMPSTLSPFDRNDAAAHPGNWIIPGSVAYVAQTPWLEAASLRDNVLFGLPFVESRYKQVIDVCSLIKDLEVLADGDFTELGASGINLSGGQKWRVTLARAIYSRAEILIMDDIFSAVDAHVGRQIFENCISGVLCKGRTRILVTHHVALVQPQTRFLVELGEGSVLHAGQTSELAEDGSLQRIKSREQPLPESRHDDGSESMTVVESEGTSAVGEEVNEAVVATSNPKSTTQNPKKFIQEETREKGMVNGRIYAAYMQACGGWIPWVVCILIFVGAEASNLGRGWWVRIWTSSQSSKAVSTSLDHQKQGAHAYSLTFEHSLLHSPYISTNTRTAAQGQLQYYLSVYVALSLLMALVGTFRFWWCFRMSIKGSKILFSHILHTILRTPMRWLDTVPVGRILNRLTADFEIIDIHLAFDFSLLLWYTLSLVGVCVAGVLVSSYFIPPAVILLVISALLAKKYLGAARPLRRIESTSKSPVFELFNTTLAGISTLRAFQKTNTYIQKMYSGLDHWNIISITLWTVNRWLGFRLCIVGTVFTAAIGIIVIMSPEVDASMAGFTLSFALGFSFNMMMAIRNYSELELNMNAAERVIEYSELEVEPQGGKKPPAAWPRSGVVEVKDLVVSYAQDLDPVLKGVSFEVKNNERIGVIGRTGAGKSSLTLALFRFLEARSGSVFIDGLDISEVDLHSLRSRLAIIPQDPVLFSGTIRSNLDPFDDRTDDELKEALTRVHLSSNSETILPETTSAPASTTGSINGNTNIFNDLSSPVSESGGNLSQGQRQLLCLARAIVSRPKIMVLDEATSAVDMGTDALIQRSIREEFSDSTLIVIAHRLSTIADFDRILVLSHGEVAEYGTPRELWEQRDGAFRGMCESSGERDKLRSVIFGGAVDGDA